MWLVDVSPAGDALRAAFFSAPVVGALAGAQPAPSTSTSGTVAVAGAAAQNQNAPSASEAGAVAVAGASSTTVAAPTSSEVGSVAIAGAVSQTQTGPSMSEAGAVAIGGAAAQTHGAPSISAAGTVQNAAVVGAHAVTQAAPTTSAIGKVTIVGAAAQNQNAPTTSATGHVPIAVMTIEATAAAIIEIVAIAQATIVIRSTMPTNFIARGTRARISATFKADDSPFDPTTVRLRLRRPGRGPEAYTYGVGDDIIKTATGEYYFEILVNWVGTATYRWESVAPNQESYLEGTVVAPKTAL